MKATVTKNGKTISDKRLDQYDFIVCDDESTDKRICNSNLSDLLDNAAEVLIDLIDADENKVEGIVICAHDDTSSVDVDIDLVTGSENYVLTLA